MYIDNVLIYSNRLQKDYKEKVKAVITKLGEAGLHLDVNKSKYSIKSTKYLRFIIKQERASRKTL